MKTRSILGFAILMLFQSAFFLFSSPTNAFTLGCNKAQSSATEHLKRAFYFQNLEINYYRKGVYQNAYSAFQSAVESYYQWNKVVNKSPKCFTKDNYAVRSRAMLKGYENNQTMSSRYGNEIAKRNNYGSSDPCFKYLGEDSAYLNCSIGIGEKEGRNSEYGP